MPRTRRRITPPSSSSSSRSSSPPKSPNLSAISDHEDQGQIAGAAPVPATDAISLTSEIPSKSQTSPVKSRSSTKSQASGSNHDWSDADDSIAGDSSNLSLSDSPPSGGTVTGVKSPAGSGEIHSRAGDGGQNIQDSAKSPLSAGDSLGTSLSLIPKDQRKESLESSPPPFGGEAAAEGSEDDCIVTGETRAPAAENSPVTERARAGAEASNHDENFTVVKPTNRDSPINTQNARATASEPAQASKHARTSEANPPSKADKPASAGKREKKQEHKRNASPPENTPEGKPAGAELRDGSPAKLVQAAAKPSMRKSTSASEHGDQNAPAKSPTAAKRAESPIVAKPMKSPATQGEGTPHKAALPSQKQGQSPPRLNPWRGRVGGGNHPDHPDVSAVKAAAGEASAADKHAAKGGEKRRHSPSPPPTNPTKIKAAKAHTQLQAPTVLQNLHRRVSCWQSCSRSWLPPKICCVLHKKKHPTSASCWCFTRSKSQLTANRRTISPSSSSCKKA